MGVFAAQVCAAPGAVVPEVACHCGCYAGVLVAGFKWSG